MGKLKRRCRVTLMRFVLLLLLASVATTIAQKSDEKERLIFQPGAKEPGASPTPAPARKLDKPAETLDLAG